MEPISTMAAGLAYGFLKKIIEKKSISLYDSFEKQFIEAINDNINRYLENQMNYYSQMKTVLTSNIPKPFRDIYYPLSISTKSEFGMGTKKEKILECSIENVFRYSNYVLIYGDAGSGKSSIVKHLFLGCIEQEDSTPILIEFRHLNTSDVGLIDYIFRKLLNSEIKDNESDIKKILHGGVFTFFFDGYDEINPEFQEKIVNELEEFIKTYNTNKFVITTRPYSNIEYLQQFHNYKVEDLKDTDIKPFTEKQMRAIFGKQYAEEYAEAVTNSVLNSENSAHIKSFMRNPLLLSLYILTFQLDASLPPTKSAFYARVINVLLSEHDSLTKIGYKRTKKTKLTNEELTMILGLFSYATYAKALYEWSYDTINRVLDGIKSKVSWVVFNNEDFIYDMKVSISLWVEESGHLKFAHRSLQEYFVALHIKNNSNIDKYDKFIKSLERDTSGSVYLHRNVFDLCEELDFTNININLILPFLKSQVEKITHLNDNELVEACFQLEVTNITCVITKMRDNFKIMEIKSNHSKEEYPKLILLGKSTKLVHHVFYLLRERKYKSKLAKLCEVLGKNLDMLGENIYRLEVLPGEFDSEMYQLEIMLDGKLSNEVLSIYGMELTKYCKKFITVLERLIYEKEEILRQKGEC